MLLEEARSGQVVRNCSNANHYRFDRPEKSRVRIRPLELFPSGLLIAKPTDTLINPDIAVDLVGPWVEGMRVEGKPTHSAESYARELAAREAELVVLLAQYEELPVNGTGKLSRGSHANKIKNCEARIVTLRLGLADPDESVRLTKTRSVVDRLIRGQAVLLPSGRLATVDRTNGNSAKVTCLVNGASFTANLSLEAIRPLTSAYSAR